MDVGKKDVGAIGNPFLDSRHSPSLHLRDARRYFDERLDLRSSTFVGGETATLYDIMGPGDIRSAARRT